MIQLNHRIFTEDPHKAFATRYNVSPKLWYEIYNTRFMWHQYEIPILCEYFKLKTQIDVHERTIRRWIKRTQLYNKAQIAKRRGAREVNTDFFREEVTEKELTDLLNIK